MLKLPLVSFVVTSYNYEKYLSKTLESIKAQTYKNFEIIIVDDCSTDNSYKIAENFVSENQDLKITLVKLEKNSGQLAGMVRGLVMLAEMMSLDMILLSSLYSGFRKSMVLMLCSWDMTVTMLCLPSRSWKRTREIRLNVLRYGSIQAFCTRLQSCC